MTTLRLKRVCDILYEMLLHGINKQGTYALWHADLISEREMQWLNERLGEELPRRIWLIIIDRAIQTDQLFLLPKGDPVPENVEWVKRRQGSRRGA